jgi:hypothetical protein
LTQEELISRLVQIENMNRDWVAYNDQREVFVQELTAKHHSTANELSNAVAEIQSLRQNQVYFIHFNDLKSFLRSN